MAENEQREVWDMMEENDKYYDQLLDDIDMVTLIKTWIASPGHKTGCKVYT